MNRDFLFADLFRSKSITVFRLLVFARVVVAALAVLDKTTFAALMAELNEAIAILSREIGEVDGNKNTQKISTKTVNAFIKKFAAYMSENEPFIARAVGGRSSNAYMAIYPNGVSEYSKPAQAMMDTLTFRLLKAAMRYADLLGEQYTAELESFSPDFLEMYTNHQTQKGTVQNDRTERSAAANTLSLVLTKAVHTVAAQYPGNVAVGSQVFAFDLLYPKSVIIKKDLKGMLAVLESRAVLNQMLTARATVAVTNLSLNADALVWLSAAGTGPAPATANVVKANSSLIFKAGKLGSLTNTFLIIANASDVNGGLEYKIQVAGLKKEKAAGQQPETAKKNGEADKDITIVSA